MRSSSPVRDLAHDYWEFQMRENPLWATYVGDHRYSDRLPDPGPAGRRREHKANAEFLARLEAADPADDPVTCEALRFQLELAIDGERHKFWQWNVDQIDGPQANFPQLINYHPLRNEKDGHDLVSRYRAFGEYMDAYLENLREGVQDGRVAPRIAVDRVRGQLDTMLSVPAEKSPFMTPRAPVLESVRSSIYPALERMREFLRSYRGRDEVGLCALPGGAEAYRNRIRHHTTTDLSAEEIHRIGLEEVEQLESRMRKIAGGDLRAFAESLQRDPANYYSSREELEADATRLLRKLEAKLPEVFRVLPAIPCVVKRIEDYREKDSVAAFCYPPPHDGSRPGIYYINTFRPETRPRYNLPALTAHEAVPGHHLQLALAVELRDLPLFRRFAQFTAYVEGWALYAELLADELGVYETDLERFGMLTYQAWRACRLVVDTGLHALGWSRDRAVAFFGEHLALSGPEIANEVDRYIIWPGQALAYTIGRREIQSLRSGDVKDFHHEVLRHGALPLSVLRKCVKRI